MIDSLLTSLVGLVNTAAPLTVVVALTTAILVFPLPQSAARARTVSNASGPPAPSLSTATTRTVWKPAVANACDTGVPDGPVTVWSKTPSLFQSMRNVNPAA